MGHVVSLCKTTFLQLFETSHHHSKFQSVAKTSFCKKSRDMLQLYSVCYHLKCFLYGTSKHTVQVPHIARRIQASPGLDATGEVGIFLSAI